ncbi:WD40-repeat-containing domain protein [Lipomyces kononenkoae]|uniref:WD40-repeat-containing domain protein n=1 Tax=Lipomyces kononenkoae TaxID=34357 RepID=A0ACC3SX86_LIPKO
MTPSFLTNRQRDELNASILQYFAASGLQASHEALRNELGIRDGGFDEDVTNYDGLLEKKWTSVVRLQKKIMDLESHVASLQTELDTLPSSSRKVTDPVAWLPRTSKYTLVGHRQAINTIAFHPVFSVLASGSDDTMIKIWDWELGELERTVKGHTKGVLDLDFGGRPGEELLASSSADLTIKLWDANDEYKNVRTLKGHDHTVSCVKFHPDGERIVSASRDKTLRIWAVKTGYCLRSIVGHSDWIKEVVPTSDGELLLSVGADYMARITEVLTGDNRLTIAAHDHVIECCAIAPASSYNYIATLSESKRIPPASSSFEYFATGSRDRTIKIWDVRGNLLLTLVGHDNWVRSVVFHPGGKFLISAGDDKTIRCWDLTQGGQCVRTIENAHDHFVSALKWAPSINVKEQNGPFGANRNGNGNGLAAGNSSVSYWRNVRCVVASASVHMDVKIWTA